MIHTKDYINSIKRLRMDNAPRSVDMRQSYEPLGGRHPLWLKVSWVAISVISDLHSQIVADTNIRND